MLFHCLISRSLPPRHLSFLGDESFSTGDLDSAESAYKQGLEIDPSDEQLPVKLEEVAAEKKRLEEGAADSAKQAKLAEKMAAGDEALAKEDFDGALTAYRSGLELEP
eukprot:COSAG06_NODE_37711_length_432_cov_0.549550_1_plen_107_part_10